MKIIQIDKVKYVLSRRFPGHLEVVEIKTGQAKTLGVDSQFVLGNTHLSRTEGDDKVVLLSASDLQVVPRLRRLDRRTEGWLGRLRRRWATEVKTYLKDKTTKDKSE